MIQSSGNLQDSNCDVPTFSVRRNGRKEQLTYSQLFAAAHRIWSAGNFQKAKQIFAELSAIADRGPRAQIFLAHCHVMLGDYAKCSSILNRSLPKEVYGDAAGQLHDAFVLWKVGLFVDVKNGLKSLALAHAKLPVFSLLLADLLQSTGAQELSARFFRRAVDNDRPDGAVALAARSTLKSMSNN